MNFVTTDVAAASRWGPPIHALVRTASACAGQAEAATLDGLLGIEGNATPIPSAGFVNLTIGYAYEAAVTPSGGSTQYTCFQTAFVVTTADNGSFVANFTLPRSGCTHAGCTEYTGPYSAFSVALTDPSPAGYFLNGSLAWPTSRLWLVAALQELSFVPEGPLTVSVDAPTTVRAEAWTANDLPSPGNLTFGFSIAAPEWRLSNLTGDGATILALPAASPTNLVAEANGTFHGHALTAVAARLELSAISTNITGASVDPTQLDVGADATFTLVGAGAEGYNYTAALHPGLGAPAVNQVCLEGSAPGGAVSIACSISFVYQRVGVAQPYVVLTNRYSSATWTFPELAVRSALELTGTPAALRGYAGAPLSVALAVAQGSGTAPFGPACLATGVGTILCDVSAGPTWSFAPYYPAVGRFVATGTVLDAADSNASVELPVTIAARPSVGELVASSQAPDLGTPVDLSAVLSGGLAPFEVWWNDSLPRTTIASSSANLSGPLVLEYTPTVPGRHVVTLTILDGLGTVVAAEIALLVEPPAAELGWTAGAPPVSATAGGETRLSLFAESQNGTRTPSYATTVTLEVIEASNPPPIWINGSVPGALEGTGPGVFQFNATAWFGGYLNFTLTLLRAGIYEFRLVAPIPLAGAPPGEFELAVGPDLHALRLTAPHVMIGGSRTNSTLWHLVDPFGNPAPPGLLYLVESFDGTTRENSVPIEANSTTAWAWVNYTAPTSSSGSIAIVTEWNQTLTVLSVPAGTGGADPALLTLVAASTAVGLTVALLSALYFRRRHGVDRGGGEVEPEELRQYAEGRARLLDRVRNEGPLSLERLLQGTGGTASHELNEWLASLVTEGLVTIERGPGGAACFTAGPSTARTTSPKLPRPVLDPSALERLEFQRREDTGGGPEGVTRDLRLNRP